MQSHRSLMQCPFCKKMSVEAYHHPAYSQATTSRISGGSKTIYKRIPESTEPMADCSNCGKKLKEIKKALDEPIKKESHKEVIKRFKDSGLPLTIGSGEKSD